MPSTIASLVCVLAVAAGCGKKASDAAADPDRPASVSADVVEVADKYTGLMEALASDVVAAGTDCKKAAAAVEARNKEAAPVVEAAAKIKDTTAKDPAAKAWFEKRYTPRMMAAFEKMGATAGACRSDKDFDAAMANSPLIPRKKKHTD